MLRGKNKFKARLCHSICCYQVLDYELSFINCLDSVDLHKIKAAMHFIKLILIVLIATPIEAKLVDQQGFQATAKTSTNFKQELFFGYHVRLSKSKSKIDSEHETKINTSYQQMQSRRKLWKSRILKPLINRIRTRTLKYGLSFRKKLFL